MTTANGDAAATPATDPQAQLDALFRGPRERFTAERNALAKRLAAAGDAPAAARVKALSKPNVSAWAVNQLWWTRQSDVEALLEAGRRQARALHGGAGPSEQATAGQARRRALDTLATAAESILQQAGHAAGPATLRRISTTLEALAAHGLRPDGPHPGRLSADLDPPGFDLLAALAAADPPPPEPSAPPPNPTAPTPDPAADEARAEAEAVLATALRARETARDDSEHAARCLDEIIARHDEALLAARSAADAFEVAKGRLAEARRTMESAELTARRTRLEVDHHRTRRQEARGTLEGRSQTLRTRDAAVEQARRQLDALDADD